MLRFIYKWLAIFILYTHYFHNVVFAKEIEIINDTKLQLMGSFKVYKSPMLSQSENNSSTLTTRNVCESINFNAPSAEVPFSIASKTAFKPQVNLAEYGPVLIQCLGYSGVKYAVMGTFYPTQTVPDPFPSNNQTFGVRKIVASDKIQFLFYNHPPIEKIEFVPIKETEEDNDKWKIQYTYSMYAISNFTYGTPRWEPDQKATWTYPSVLKIEPHKESYFFYVYINSERILGGNIELVKFDGVRRNPIFFPDSDLLAGSLHIMPAFRDKHLFRPVMRELLKGYKGKKVEFSLVLSNEPAKAKYGYIFGNAETGFKKGVKAEIRPVMDRGEMAYMEVYQFPSEFFEDDHE